MTGTWRGASMAAAPTDPRLATTRKVRATPREVSAENAMTAAASRAW